MTEFERLLAEEQESIVTLKRTGATWRDAEGWNYGVDNDGLFHKMITGDIFELVKVLGENLVLVR